MKTVGEELSDSTTTLERRRVLDEAFRKANELIEHFSKNQIGPMNFEGNGGAILYAPKRTE